MTGFSSQFGEDDPVQTVRTIGRIAQMLVELRDEYVAREREDTLHQIEQRIADLQELVVELQQRIAQQKEEA